MKIAMIGRQKSEFGHFLKMGMVRKTWKNTSEKIHVNNVVTDWSYVLVWFLVSTLFGVSSGQS